MPVREVVTKTRSQTRQRTTKKKIGREHKRGEDSDKDQSVQKTGRAKKKG